MNQDQATITASTAPGAAEAAAVPTVEPAAAPVDADERVGGDGEGSGASVSRRKRPGAVAAVAAVAIVVGTAYVLYQRIGTTADADLVEFTQNVAGGFLAVAMTKERPGFVVLSELDQNRVDVDVQRYENGLAGNFAVATVQTSKTDWHERLRRPMVVLVGADGSVRADKVDWSRDDFESIREGVDCSHVRVAERHRCGMPFIDLFDLVADGRLPGVPSPMRAFLAGYMKEHGSAAGRSAETANAALRKSGEAP